MKEQNYPSNTIANMTSTYDYAKLIELQSKEGISKVRPENVKTKQKIMGKTISVRRNKI